MGLGLVGMGGSVAVVMVDRLDSGQVPRGPVSATTVKMKMENGWKTEAADSDCVVKQA
jgi:hypothetical protein